MWDPSNEAFRVAGPGGLKGPLTLFQHAVGSMMMDILGGEHGDPCVAMLGVVPGEERAAEVDGSGEVSWKRPGKPGWYFRVLNCASENGLSSDTWGRLSERVTPRSASSCAVHLLVIGAPRSECRVSTWGWTPCLWQVCSMRRPASAEFSRSATIQPTA